MPGRIGISASFARFLLPPCTTRSPNQPKPRPKPRPRLNYRLCYQLACCLYLQHVRRIRPPMGAPYMDSTRTCELVQLPVLSVLGGGKKNWPPPPTCPVDQLSAQDKRCSVPRTQLPKKQYQATDTPEPKKIALSCLCRPMAAWVNRRRVTPLDPRPCIPPMPNPRAKTTCHRLATGTRRGCCPSVSFSQANLCRLCLLGIPMPVTMSSG